MPARVELIIVTSPEVELWIVAPAFASGFRIEGDHAVKWCAEIQRALDHQRRDLKGAGASAFLPSETSPVR